MKYLAFYRVLILIFCMPKNFLLNSEKNMSEKKWSYFPFVKK